jgi:hypothetical protein
MGRPALVLVACFLAASASAQEFTALKCHTSRTPRLPPSAILQLEALVPDFAGKNCRVTGRTKDALHAGPGDLGAAGVHGADVLGRRARSQLQLLPHRVRQHDAEAARHACCWYRWRT